MGSVGLVLAKIGMSLVAQLLTEKFIKGMLIHGMELAAKKSQTETDDKIVADIKKAWGIE